MDSDSYESLKMNDALEFEVIADSRNNSKETYEDGLIYITIKFSGGDEMSFCLEVGNG